MAKLDFLWKMSEIKSSYTRLLVHVPRMVFSFDGAKGSKISFEVLKTRGRKGSWIPWLMPNARDRHWRTLEEAQSSVQSCTQKTKSNPFNHHNFSVLKMAQDSQASKYRSCFICSGGFPTIPAPKWWEEESYNIQYFHYKNTMLKNLSWEKT